MKKTAFFLCGFILAPAALSAALEPGEVVASGRLEAQRLDTRAAAVCRISSADELGAFVCNNVEDWARGGDTLTPAASVRITPMRGEASAPQSWEASGAPVTVGQPSPETLWTWEVPCSSLYLAELVYFDGTVGGRAFFDCSSVAGLKLSLASLCVSLDRSSFHYDSTLKRPEVVITDAEGAVLREGVDYRVIYPDTSVAVGGYSVRIEGIGAYGDALVLPYSVEWLVIAGESQPSRIDTRDVEVIEIPSAKEMRPFIWNTSPAWLLGGGEATRSARLVCAPLSAPDAEPGDAGAFVRTFGSGEGLYDWRRHDKGYYRVSLEFTTNGVVDAKATLSRVVYLGFTAWNGQAIIVR
jgi:hypothetical protein